MQSSVALAHGVMRRTRIDNLPILKDEVEVRLFVKPYSCPIVIRSDSFPSLKSRPNRDLAIPYCGPQFPTLALLPLA